LAWTWIVATELFDQLFVAMNNALAAFDLGFGWETTAAFAGALKRSRARCDCALP
jgi:hypothetical protein